MEIKPVTHLITGRIQFLAVEYKNTVCFDKFAVLGDFSLVSFKRLNPSRAMFDKVSLGPLDFQRAFCPNDSSIGLRAIFISTQAKTSSVDS